MQFTRAVNFHFSCFAILGALALSSCSRIDSHHFSSQKQFTDLGRDNDAVASRLLRYQGKSSHCKSVSGVNYRVMLTGFGPFGGVPVNTSGLVAMNFSRFMNRRNPRLIIPKINESDANAIVHQDIVKINNARIAVCAVETSVIWDLAGSIYLHEASLFKPDLIIMSGVDSRSPFIGTWEQYSSNIAIGKSGYEGDGRASSVTPVQSNADSTIEIFPGGPENIFMTWDAADLAAKTNLIVREKLENFELWSSPTENTGDYLCNNVSYVVLAAIAGFTLPLAGGNMIVHSGGLRATKVGFFHYPSSSPHDEYSVKVWSEVMAKAIEAEMGNIFTQ